MFDGRRKFEICAASSRKRSGMEHSVKTTEKKFKEKYLAGEIRFEEIDDYSQDWGFSDEPVTLREYLGLNAEEEDAWVSVGDEALKELLDRQRETQLR